MCPIFIGRENNSKVDLEKNYLEIEKYPRNLLINFDDSCNLMCESCKNTVSIAQGSEYAKNIRYADLLIRQVLSHAKFIIMAKTGEVFVEINC